MRRAWLFILCAFCLSVLVTAIGCTTGFNAKPPQERAIIILTAFEASWDEACTVEWLRCDVTAYADQITNAAIEVIQKNPQTWKSQALAVITAIQSRAQVNDLLGRWAAWLDVARAAIESI